MGLFSEGKVGRVRILEGNSFSFGQDHSFSEGIPALDYDVYETGLPEYYKLRAEGYGAENAYGNGALFVRKRDINPIMQKE